MLERTVLSIKSGYYKEQFYQQNQDARTNSFINKIRILQRTRRNIIYYGKLDYSFH